MFFLDIRLTSIGSVKNIKVELLVVKKLPEVLNGKNSIIIINKKGIIL